MESFRERILEIIHRFGSASAPDLSKILGISKPAVQYHLRQLLATSDIELSNTNQSVPSRGRPIRYYRIAESRYPNNYENLCDSLIAQALTATDDKTELDHRLKSLAVSLVGVVPVQASFIKQIDHAVERLTAHSYQPHWEVASSGSIVRLQNCPYAHLVHRHPELCRMDTFLLETLLGIPVQVKYLWKDHPETKESCSFFFKR